MQVRENILFNLNYMLFSLANMNKIIEILRASTHLLFTAPLIIIVICYDEKV